MNFEPIFDIDVEFIDLIIGILALIRSFFR